MESHCDVDQQIENNQDPPSSATSSTTSSSSTKRISKRISSNRTVGVMNERVRSTLSPRFVCLFFCGGIQCKYERTDCWSDEEKVLKEVYSHWVTPNIVAMSRPNANRLDPLITELEREGIKTIINLQQRFEHVHCAPTLSASSGFTYDPDAFMRRNIYFYNFEWADFSSASSASFLLDAVKVLDFSLQEGKVAIHCHAGLGRTGLLIACYLLYSKQLTQATAAIEAVRAKRSQRAIQSKAQIAAVQSFQHLMETVSVPTVGSSTSLAAALRTERKLLHGLPAKRSNFTPRLLSFIFSRFENESDQQRLLTALMFDFRSLSSASKSFRVSLDSLKALPVDSLPTFEPTIPLPLLSALLFSFFATLDPPILSGDALVAIVTRTPPVALASLDPETRATLAPILSFLASCFPLTSSPSLFPTVVARFISELTQHRVKLFANSCTTPNNAEQRSNGGDGDEEESDHMIFPSAALNISNWPFLGKGTLFCLMRFFNFFREKSEKDFIEDRKNQLSVQQSLLEHREHQQSLFLLPHQPP